MFSQSTYGAIPLIRGHERGQAILTHDLARGSALLYNLDEVICEPICELIREARGDLPAGDVTPH